MEGLNGHFVNIFHKTRHGRTVPIFDTIVSTANECVHSKTNIVAKDGAALPLLNPALTGRGQGWGLYIIHSQDVRDPTPTPPLEGRGAAAHCFWVVF